MTAHIVAPYKNLMGLAASMQEVVSSSVDAATGHTDYSGGCCC